MVSVEEALQRVREAAGAPRARTEAVPLDRALGRTLAEDVRMDHDVPPFRRSAMDGFAFAAAQAAPGVPLRVVGRVAAGERAEATLGAGEAVRILTGAPLPPGADAVVPFEAADEAEGAVRLRRPVPAGDCVIAQGEHARRGDLVLRRGTRIGPAHVAALATAGRESVPVAAAPRVAVLGTGTEIVPVGRRPEGAQIRDSNGPMLRAAVRRAGGEPTDLGLVGDAEEDLRAAIRRGRDADQLLVSGGVSRGDLDLVPAALEAEGVRCAFHRWAVQPGGPLWFGARGDALVFGLPGNPAASFVGFEVLAVPALRTRLGLPFAPRRAWRARAAGPLGAGRGKTRFRPARLESGDDGRLRANVARWRGSGDPFAWTEAAALLVLPPDAEVPEGGEAIFNVIPLGGEA